MKIAVLGATGGTGKAFIEQALGAGHEIAALVRDPSKLDANAAITVIEGNAESRTSVLEALKGADAVFCALGSYNRKRNRDVSGPTRVLLEAMRETGANRLVVVSTIGVGDSLASVKSFFFRRIIIGMLAKNIWRDRERQEALIKASNLNWTIARPGRLTDDAYTGKYQVAASDVDQPKQIAIARADVADFCLKALPAAEYHKRTVCLFY